MTTSFVYLALTVLIQFLYTQAQYTRVCYYTNWAQYRPKGGKFYPEDIDPNLCTHLVYAFAKLNGNRLEAFEWNDESTDWMRGMYDRFNDLKMRNPAIKTLLAVGGWNMASKPFTAMVATPAARREFATTSVRFLRERNFDGLDLDWEYPANRGSPPEDRQRYAQLVSEIRRAFDNEARLTNRQPLLLTSAVAAGKDKIDTAYDIPQVCRDMDFISVMTYDLHGSWEDITGHNSPLFPHSGETGNQRFLNMDWAANYWVQNGCPKSKLVIGMGLYGRSFTLKDPYDNGLMAHVRGKGEPGKYTREGGFLAYYEICDSISKGAPSYYIKEQESPYMVNGDQWVGYDDVDSLRIKVQWMKQNGFAGVMVWALDLDDYTNKCGQGKYPLLTAINQELLGSIPSPPKNRPNRVQSNAADRPALPAPLPTVNNNNMINNNNRVNHRTRAPMPPAPPMITRVNNNVNMRTNRPVNLPPNMPASIPAAIPANTNNNNNVPQNLPHLTNEFDCPPSVNTYFGSPNNCEEYYICADGLSFKFKCAAPLKWNEGKKFCDWPDNVLCNKKSAVKPAPGVRTIVPVRRTTARRTTATTTTTRRPTTRNIQRFIPRETRRITARPVFTTPAPSFAQPTPPWLDWSTFITEFWRALTSMAGRNNGLLRTAPSSESLIQALQSMQSVPPVPQPQPFPAALQPVIPAQQVAQVAPAVAAGTGGQLHAKFCAGKTDGIHPHPSDCNKYVDCVQGREYPGTCPAGTAFDSTYGVCDYTHKITRCAIQGFQ